MYALTAAPDPFTHSSVLAVCRSRAALDRALTRYRDALLSARLTPVNCPSALAAANRRIQRCWAGAIRQGATLTELQAVGRSARPQRKDGAPMNTPTTGYVRNERTGQIRKDTVADALGRWQRVG